MLAIRVFVEEGWTCCSLLETRRQAGPLRRGRQKMRSSAGMVKAYVHCEVLTGMSVINGGTLEVLAVESVESAVCRASREGQYDACTRGRCSLRVALAVPGWFVRRDCLALRDGTIVVSAVASVAAGSKRVARTGRCFSRGRDRALHR